MCFQSYKPKLLDDHVDVSNVDFWIWLEWYYEQSLAQTEQNNDVLATVGVNTPENEKGALGGSSFYDIHISAQLILCEQWLPAKRTSHLK